MWLKILYDVLWTINNEHVAKCWKPFYTTRSVLHMTSVRSRIRFCLNLLFEIASCRYIYFDSFVVILPLNQICMVFFIFNYFLENYLSDYWLVIIGYTSLAPPLLNAFSDWSWIKYLHCRVSTKILKFDIELLNRYWTCFDIFNLMQIVKRHKWSLDLLTQIHCRQ